MPLITETYYLSLTQDNRGILRLRCSQDDTLRTVNLKLYNNGSIFAIPSGISASVSGVKQNGAVFSKPCTISQDRESVVLQLSSDITNTDGIIVAEIVLNDGEGGRLGTSNFIIQVEKNPIRAGVVQDTETPIEYISDFIDKIQTLTARLNNLITPSGDASLAEVVDARIGVLDSTIYQTLGARLNAEFQRLSNALNGITILESTGDTTDRTSEILSKLNAYGTCKLGKGDFYVNSLIMPEGSQLVGSGNSTRIVLPSSVTSGYVVKPRSNCIVENISFYGGFTGTYSELIASGASAQRHCIILDRFDNISSENVILSNIFINNFVGSAIVQRATNGCHCKDAVINMCYAGIDISNTSYDGQCANVYINDTRYGIIQNGSNFVFSCCISKDSEYHIMSDQQNTECIFSSCTFFDSSLETTSTLAILSNARNGFVFDSCMFDSSLKIGLIACDGIVIKGTNFVGSDTFKIIVQNGRNTLLLITDCIADVEPVVTNVGTAARITSCYLKDGTAWSISEADITVDDELSDESENPVQNKVVAGAISEIKADLVAVSNSIFSNSDIDLSTVFVGDGIISGQSGNWIRGIGNYTYFVPVSSEFGGVEISASSERATVVGIVKSDTTTHGSTPQYASGCAREIVSPGETKYFTIPSDAKYVSIMKSLGNVNYTPTSVNLKKDKYITLESFLGDKTLGTWELGSYNYPDGANYASTSRIRLTYFCGKDKGIFSVKSLDGYEFSVFAWDKSTNDYIGTLMSTNAISKRGTMKWMTSFDFGLYPDYLFKIALRNATSPTSAITVDESLNVIFTCLVIGQEENEEDAIERITYMKPPSVGHLNVVRRARQMTDIKWTPAFDIPRISQMAKYTGGANDAFFEDVFKAGTEYTGIPYGQATRHATNWGKDGAKGMKLGWTVGFDTFISAISNPESIVAKDSVYNDRDGNHNACFYAMICTALCGYAFGLETYYTTGQIKNAPGMTNLGLITSVGVSGLQMGDMILNASHGAIITDKLTDDDGVVIAVEISEATTIGNDNWNIQGSQYGGLCRRRMWAVSDFMTKWGSYYNVYRYAYIENVTYTKSPYVDTGNEGDFLRVVTFPVMPYMGESFQYVSGHIVNTKILTPGYKEGYTDKLRVKKDGVNWNSNGTTDYYDVSGQYVEVGFADIGTYEAYLCQVVDGVEVIQTRAGHWTVVAE